MATATPAASCTTTAPAGTGVGIFTQPDTIVPDAKNPQALNRYAYALNNPVRHIDPSGHLPWDSLNDFFHDVQSDVKGRDILLHWLYGGGKELDSVNDKSWNEYMMSNNILTQKTSNLVKGLVSQVDYEQSKTFDISTSMEIENGEQIIGYKYLHATNADVGGYRVTGTIAKDRYGSATIDFTYQWNDIIDPNLSYSTDKAKAQLANGIPFANPTDYIIRISWSNIAALDTNGNYTSGWFYLPTPTPVPPPQPGSSPIHSGER